MARGKHAKAVASRTALTVSQAQDQARNAELRANRLERLVAERDAEIAWLKDAVEKARVESTLAGTYTDADIATLQVEAERKHLASVRAGFAVLSEFAGDFLPAGHLAEILEAFDCTTEELLASATPVRRVRRATRNVREIEEYHRQRTGGHV